MTTDTNTDDSTYPDSDPRVSAAMDLDAALTNWTLAQFRAHRPQPAAVFPAEDRTRELQALDQALDGVSAAAARWFWTTVPAITMPEAVADWLEEVMGRDA